MLIYDVMSEEQQNSEKPAETVEERIFETTMWDDAFFDNAGKLVVIKKFGQVIKYMAVVYPDDYRVAIKIPYEANMTIEELRKAIDHLGVVALAKFSEQKLSQKQ